MYAQTNMYLPASANGIFTFTVEVFEGIRSEFQYNPERDEMVNLTLDPFEGDELLNIAREEWASHMNSFAYC